MHTKLERLLSKSLTTLEVMSYYLVVHTGPDLVLQLLLVYLLPETTDRSNNNNNMIIAFKGAIKDCLLSPHCAANCLQYVRSSDTGAVVCKSRATHRALITCYMSCYVPRGTKGQLSY